MVLLTIILIALPVILIIALFTRKGIKTEAAIDINKSQQQVFDYLVLLKNQEHYNAWMMVDTKMRKTYTGVGGQPGSMLAWESKNLKDGKVAQKLIRTTAPELIEIELIFEKPVPSRSRYWFELSALSDSQTHVVWRYEGNPVPYYLLRVSQMLFRLKRQVNKYMLASLKNLKEVLEN